MLTRRDLDHLAQRVRSEPDRARFILSRVLWQTGLCRFFTIRFPDYTLRFHPSSHSAELWRNPSARANNSFFQDYLKPGDRVIDVGANIGTLTLMAAAAVGPYGRVYAFEPHPRIFRFLEQNIALNSFKTISVFNAALGSCDSSILFSDARDDTQNRIAVSDGSVEVKQLRLDDTVQEDNVHLMKIDVEGYEKAVLDGSPHTLERTQCIYYESSEALFRTFGYSTEDVLRLLQNAGFDIYRTAGERVLVKVSDGYVSEEVENLIAIRNLAEFTGRTNYSLGVARCVA